MTARGVSSVRLLARRADIVGSASFATVPSSICRVALSRAPKRSTCSRKRMTESSQMITQVQWSASGSQ
jgi:hypothetical protein